MQNLFLRFFFEMNRICQISHIYENNNNNNNSENMPSLTKLLGTIQGLIRDNNSEKIVLWDL